MSILYYTLDFLKTRIMEIILFAFLRQHSHPLHQVKSQFGWVLCGESMSIVPLTHYLDIYESTLSSMSTRIDANEYVYIFVFAHFDIQMYNKHLNKYIVPCKT